MIKNTKAKINVKFWSKCSPFLDRFPPFLYINRNLALPSLCKALHKDGWGEGYEQREIRLGDDRVYISFWNSDDDYFLKPESEVFPENKMDMTMGGLS